MAVISRNVDTSVALACSWFFSMYEVAMSSRYWSGRTRYSSSVTGAKYA